MNILTSALNAGGKKAYWTEWSDTAEAGLPTSGIKVIDNPNPPDGTVCIQCTCGGSIPGLMEA